MWLYNVIYFCVSNCVCCAQGVAEEQLRLMLSPCLNNKIKKTIYINVKLQILYHNYQILFIVCACARAHPSSILKVTKYVCGTLSEDMSMCHDYPSTYW